jgi:hypothetical protein
METSRKLDLEASKPPSHPPSPDRLRDRFLATLSNLEGPFTCQCAEENVPEQEK